MKRKYERKQYTAELIPIQVSRDGKVMGEGYILVREDGTESYPILHDFENNVLTENSYTLFPLWNLKYLVVVPQREIH